MTGIFTKAIPIAAAAFYSCGMNPVSVDTLSPAELAALMHFYAEAGVDWLVEDQPFDRFAEFAALANARAQPAVAVADQPASVQTGERQGRTLPSRPQATIAPPPIVVPDAEAVEAARQTAAKANTVEELIDVVANFTGCNLRISARTAFARGNVTARIMVAGGVPSPDDDREGAPFSGASGIMLERMLASIGIAADDILSFNLIPWRPPGNRQPTPHEMEVCKPFSFRLVEIVRPDVILVLGNQPARMLLQTNESIHSLRGKWTEMTAGSEKIPMLASFHPQDLLAAPLSKRLAWQDLLEFRAGLARSSNPPAG